MGASIQTTGREDEVAIRDPPSPLHFSWVVDPSKHSIHADLATICPCTSIAPDLPLSVDLTPRERVRCIFGRYAKKPETVRLQAFVLAPEEGFEPPT